MFDPRWDDSRQRDVDARGRAYEGRAQSGDPRDVFLHDLDLPVDREREVVLDRDRVYELNGDESRTLATVGTFRIVPERDLGDPRDDAPAWDETRQHLHEQELIHTVALSDHEQGVTLTGRGVELLEANRRERGDDQHQEFHADVAKERELHHDSHLYAAYRLTEACIREEHEGAASMRTASPPPLLPRPQAATSKSRCRSRQDLAGAERDRFDSRGELMGLEWA